MVAAVAVAAVVALGCVSPASAADRTAAAAPTAVRSVSDGGCLDVPGGSTSVNQVLQADRCDQTAQQTFRFVPVTGSSRTYRIRNDASGLCASDYRNQVRQSSCAGDPTVPTYGEWTLATVSRAGHTYRIEDTQTLGSAPYCMTFTSKGGDVDLNPCTGGTDDVARLIPS